MDGSSCFPSIGTIKELLNNALSIRTIQKSIKWLVDNFVIERNSKHSKNRFVNLLRKLIYGNENEQSGRLETNDLDTIREQPEQNISNPCKSPCKGDNENRKSKRKKRTIEGRLLSARKRVQKYANILSTRQSPETEDKSIDNARSNISYWIATLRLGVPDLSGSDSDIRQARELYQQDRDIREQLEMFPQIRKFLMVTV